VVWGAVTEILGQWDGEWTDEADKIVAKWADFVGRIEQLGLPDAIDRPLLLDVSDFLSGR
jgi:tRNA nucleotidyltransferase (CCA-adding enzyme)